MRIRHLKIRNFLSFGPEGIDLPLSDLNVLVGPNGSGKSNLIEILALLRALPKSLPPVLRGAGGIREWFYKGTKEGEAASFVVDFSEETELLPRHELELSPRNTRYRISKEIIRRSGASKNFRIDMLPEYQYENDDIVILAVNGTSTSDVRLDRALETESIMSQIKDVEDRYPLLSRVQTSYESIRVFRNWQFGPTADLRREQPSDARNDFLADGGENLALVVNKIKQRVKRELLANLNELYSGITDIDTVVDNGSVRLFLEEGEGRWTPASRLSDGTLRYLCLLTILLHPDPPALVALEEPELGLHPDVVPHVGKLIKAASKRMQIVMTTHSQVLLDAFSESPEDVVVCSRGEGGSHFERLDAEKLAVWLQDHSLGELWNLGEIGGTRW